MTLITRNDLTTLNLTLTNPHDT